MYVFTCTTDHASDQFLVQFFYDLEIDEIYLLKNIFSFDSCASTMLLVPA